MYENEIKWQLFIYLDRQLGPNTMYFVPLNLQKYNVYVLTLHSRIASAFTKPMYIKHFSVTY